MTDHQTLIHPLAQFCHQLVDTISHWIRELSDRAGHGVAQLFAAIADATHHVTDGFVSLPGAIADSVRQTTDGFASLVATASSLAIWQVGLYWVLLLVMAVGVIGAFVPVLPGIVLVLVAVVAWGAIAGFTGLGLAIGVSIAAFLCGVAIDYLAGLVGAQRVGASRWGQVGAIAGMLMGVIGLLPALPFGGPIVGLFFGTVLGAFVGEFLYRSELALLARTRQSLRVGIAIVVGNLIGNVLQGALAAIALSVFVMTTWSTVYGG